MANSFTWSLTTAGSSGAFDTAADWVSVNNGNANTPNFISGVDDFNIITTGSVSLTVTGISGITVGSLSVNDAGAHLVAGDSQNIFSNGLTINNGLYSASSDTGVTFTGAGATPSSIALGAGGTIDAGSASFGNLYLINGNGSGVSALTGSGTIIANGWLDVGGQMTVAAGQSLNFQIADNGINNGSNNVGILEFDNNVNSGSVTFLGASGMLLLTGAQVGTGTTLTNGGTFGATISGLAVSTDLTPENMIAIATNGFVGPTSLTASLSGAFNDILTITDGASNNYVFNLTGDYTGDIAVVQSDVTGANGLGYAGFDVFVMVCYGTGTSILTDNGEVAVESLQTGDTVMTLVDGAQVPQAVKWVGRRDLDLSRHPNADAIAPVRVLKGALGDNLPHRDLILSPDHCLFIDGTLFPAKLLVNGMTIVRELSAKSVSYFHVELDRHGVIIAEGVAAESYLDTGNRSFFSNAGLATILHPELSINENLRCWETDACAPLTVKPELVKPVWQRFVDRAVALGHSAPVHATTKDAGIHLMVDGKMVRPMATQGKTISFMVPAKAKSVRLISRSTRPNSLTPWLDDPRNLGVAIRSVTLRDQNGEAVISADHPALRAGWHAAEQAADGAMWRWTAGDAVLPINAEGPCTVEIALSATTTYIESAVRLAA